MYDANKVLRHLCVHIVHYHYDICLLMLLKCIANYDSLAESKKSATLMPT